ncbi:MAG: SPFH domain-containing protein [Isosphaeraceae bacterium]
MRLRNVWPWIVLLGALALAASGLHAVRPGERIVVRRFGRVVEPAWGPGLHWGLPLGIDRFDRVRTDQVRRLVVGPDDLDAEPAGGEFLTGDLNLIRIQAVVQYRVSDPATWVVRAAEADSILARLASSAVSSALARRGIDAALREDRPRLGAEAAVELAAVQRRLGLGVEILGVSLTDARPPAEVAADFAAAQSAESLRDRLVHEASAAAETSLAAAGARARSLLESARADAERTILVSRAQSQRFLSLLEGSQGARHLTVRRLYLDAMRSLLGGVGRTIVVPAGDAVDLTVLGVED